MLALPMGVHRRLHWTRYRHHTLDCLAIRRSIQRVEYKDSVEHRGSTKHIQSPLRGLPEQVDSLEALQDELVHLRLRASWLRRFDQMYCTVLSHSHSSQRRLQLPVAWSLAPC